MTEQIRRVMDVGDATAPENSERKIMASKLTPEQKTLNKEAKKLRDAAFERRRDAYRSEMNAAKAAIKSGDLGKSADAAAEAFNAAFSAREAAAFAIKEKIRALEEELSRVMEEHKVTLDHAKEARGVTHKREFNAILEAERAVNAKYPDMDGCYSAAAWKPVSEFAPQVGKSVALHNAKENYE